MRQQWLAASVVAGHLMANGHVQCVARRSATTYLDSCGGKAVMLSRTNISNMTHVLLTAYCPKYTRQRRDVGEYLCRRMTSSDSILVTRDALTCRQMLAVCVMSVIYSENARMLPVCYNDGDISWLTAYGIAPST